MSGKIIIRAATAEDVAHLRRVAALDGRSMPEGEVLVAEEQGELRAAIEVATGRVIANPFAPTARLVELLRIQRDHETALAA